MYSKKSIVLSGVTDSSQKGILSIEQKGDGIFGNIRLYNFDKEPNGIISLGIYNDDKVVKAGLTRVADMLFNFKSELKSIPQNFSCAVVNFVGGEPKPILYGNSNGYCEKDIIFDQVVNKLKDATTTQQVKNVLDDYDIDYSDEEKNEIEKELDKNITKEDVALCANDGKCEDCEYKKYYFSHVSSLEKHEDKEEEQISFYEEMKEHIDKLFAENPTEEYLQKLLPNSKFVRVTLEDNNYYVLGLIYSEEKLKYICYGVPGIYQNSPPRQLSGYPVWIPLDEEKAEGFGYWLTYQDAQSGESVKAIVV